jgi:hypothetical protein
MDRMATALDQEPEDTGLAVFSNQRSAQGIFEHMSAYLEAPAL